MSFRIRVVRPDDLLVATFDVRGMSLDPTGALLRDEDASEALLLVVFPAQSLVEQVLTPAEAAFLGVLDNPSHVPGFLAGFSKLAFRIPANVTGMTLRLNQLLNWTGLSPVPSLEFPPRDTATAVEAPWRVVLTTLPGAQWKHDVAPHVSGGRTALWMTELRNAASTLRVASSPDVERPFDPGFPTPLSAASRADLVRLSEQGLGSTHLALSAMGANFGADISFHPIRSAALRKWNHRMTLGRDQKVSTETEGTLFPFGHRALLAIKVERTFQRNPPVAALVGQATITVLEADRPYGTRDFPFVRVRAAIPIGVPVRLSPDPADANQFLLPVTAVDRGGAEHSFIVPVRFVPLNDFDAMVAATVQYGEPVIAAGGQAVHYAEPSGAEAAARYPTERFRMTGVVEGTDFRPKLQEAFVRLDALDELSRAVRPPVGLRYDIDYLNNGFRPGDTVRRFARLAQPMSLALGAGRIGGLANPKVDLDALSLDRGLTVPDPAALRQTLEGKLLGFLDLRTLVDTNAAGSRLPAVKMLGAANERRVEFVWDLALQTPPGGVAPALQLRGTLPLTASARPAALDGTLTNFPVTFLGLATLRFHKLMFATRPGKAPTIEHVNAALEFDGDLKFLATIAEEMARAFPGAPDGVTVTLDATALDVKVVRALPSIALGQFTLLNLAFNAGIRLNFSEPATLTFGLSSRRTPFLVSYSGFGGGGFFALELDVKGPKKLEASIELGAVAEVNFAIVKASAQVLIGFYMSLEAGKSVLGGYVRVHGAVQLLGLVTVAVDLMLMLTYSEGIVTGHAEVTICVQVWAFSKSVTLSVTRSFDTRSLPGGLTPSSGPLRLEERGTSFAERVDEAQWAAYCKAFA